MILIPSVTEVIKAWADYSKIPEHMLNIASERGKQAHDACAKRAMGLWPMDVPPNARGFYESFLRWFDHVVDEVLMVEERLVDEALGFHGQPDILVRSKHGEILLVDLKTPAALKWAWRLQMAAYNRLTIVATPWTPHRHGTLRLHSQGGVPKMDWFDERAEDLIKYLEVLNHYRCSKAA
jgi:hypothetical protein